MLVCMYYNNRITRKSKIVIGYTHYQLQETDKLRKQNELDEIIVNYHMASSWHY